MQQLLSKWLEEYISAFETLKAMIMTALALKRPHPDGHYILQIDAGDAGIRTFLFQEINGVERVLEYASRILQPTERNYSITERECLAVVWVIGKF